MERRLSISSLRFRAFKTLSSTKPVLIGAFFLSKALEYFFQIAGKNGHGSVSRVVSRVVSRLWSKVRCVSNLRENQKRSLICGGEILSSTWSSCLSLLLH